MIAYVFWHTRLEGVRVADFEQGLAAFHRSLAGDPPSGFRSSLSRRFPTLPWLGSGTVYEDWYLLDDFTALGILNARAAEGGHRVSHDRVAAYSDRGTGSIYALEAGPGTGYTRRGYWFDKPGGRSTGDFLDDVRSVAYRRGGSLWRRQLSLGPAREYCLLTDANLELSFPSVLTVHEVSIWPGDSDPESVPGTQGDVL